MIILKIKNYKKILRPILNGISDAYTITKNFRDTTKYEMGIITYEPEVVYLYEVISDALDVLSPYDKVNNTEIKNNVDTELTIIGDNDMLTSIFRNLISNSIHSISKIREKSLLYKGQIIITTHEVDDETVSICITDNGMGMPHEQAKKLFSNNIEKGVGTYLIKKFLTYHHPELEISVSSAIGKGTEIRFSLLKKVQYENNYSTH